MNKTRTVFLLLAALSLLGLLLDFTAAALRRRSERAKPSPKPAGPVIEGLADAPKGAFRHIQFHVQTNDPITIDWSKIP